MQELFSSFTARWVSNDSSRSFPSHFYPSSHKEVLDMEIQFLHENFTEKDSKSLTDHVQRMGSGEAPFFAATLSLVYGGLVENALSKHTPLDSGLGGQGVPTHTPHPRASTSTPNVTSSSNSQAPAPAPEPASSDTTTKWVGLKCTRCYGVSSVRNLRDDLYCPRCPATGWTGRGWPFMRCMTCKRIRETDVDRCVNANCSGAFV